ncbi:MAG: glycosyltransferase family 9 protein [Armatimonadetes bacterium]|nr:glycosyltransferase family 9 protein [Armatimonadota bacterium]
MKKINKILIIRIDQIGDLICSTPFIKVVRENFPESHISILVNSYTKEIVVGNPALDEILIFDSFINSSKKIKTGKFDLVIVLSPVFKAYLLAYLSGAKIRTGIIYSQRLFNQIFAKIFFTHPLILYIEETLKRKENIPHEVEQILSIAKYFNWKINAQV